jgi:hypothetical protein
MRASAGATSRAVTETETEIVIATEIGAASNR